MRTSAISSLLLFLLSTLVQAAEKSKTSQRIGDLVITCQGIQERESEQANGDHHIITIGFKAENVGKQAVCVSFRSTVRTTFGLEYDASYFGSAHPFLVRELLPGERTAGEYDFLVKNGVQPLEVMLRPISGDTACSHREDSFSAIWHSRDEVRFNLTNPQLGASQETPAPKTPIDDRPEVRVFITDEKGASPPENAIRAFSDHCPRFQITTVKEKANYVVQIIPSSFRRSKNQFLVTDQAGDMVQSGATYNLSNAAKDACTAIINNSGTRLKQ